MLEELKKLQDDLAFVDLITRAKRSGLLEVLLKNLQPLQMRMEQDKNHKMPHFHVSYGKNNHVASYSIQNGERIVGQLDNKYDKVVKNWTTNNQEKLLQIWDEIQKGDNRAYNISIGELL
jgi:Domain of unknown function (DUF4160)